MTLNEKKLLLGLYLKSKTVDNEIVYFVPELDWLIQHSLNEVANWQRETSGVKATESELDPSYEAYSKLLSKKCIIKEALSFLKGKHYIICEDRDSMSFKISVTIKGCEVARELQSLWGRMNIWYKSHKDGLLWFIVTILTSIVVSFVTTLLTRK